MHESAYGSFNGSASALSFLKNVLNAPIYRLAAFLLIMLAGLSASSFIVSEVLVLNADSENLAYASRTSYSANVVWPSSASGKVAGSTTEMVVWGGLKNAEIANGTLVSKSPCNCGVEDAQAVSSKAFYGDTSFEYTVPAVTNRTHVGVGKGATLATGSQMDLSFWHLSNGVTEIRELGVYKGEVTYKAGDVFTIEMTDGRVKYFKNEALIITSYAPYSFPMYGKASMQYLDGRVAGSTFFKLYNLDIEPVQTTTTNTESPSSTGDQTGTNSTNTSSQDNTSTPPQEDVIEFPPVDEPETVVVNLKPTGYVDGFDNNKRTVFGWAKDGNVPEGFVALHFYVDTRAGSGKSPSFTGLANITRSDVGKHGFEVPIPNKYLDGRRHTLYTYALDINDTSGSSNVLLSAATRRFRMTAPAVTPPPTTTNQAPVGSLDGVDTTRGVVYGWAKDADSESTAVDVHLYFDKNAGTSGTSPILCKADKYRSDVGNHAFDCAIPSTYADGSSHSVWAWGIDLTNSTNNIQLTGSPKTFTWGTVPAPEPAPEPAPTPPPVVSDSDPIAELPRVYVNTAMVTLGGSTINVPAGGNFQNALESARCGDTIVLAAGATYSGNFVAKNKGCTGNSWIHILSSGYANLPGPGRRVGPSDAPNMAKIVSPNVGSALLFDFGATNYRVMGLEVAGACSACDSRVYTLYSLVKMGEDENGAKATTLAQLPNNIILDRMYIHGSPTGNYRRAVQLNARAAAVIDSYISDIHEVGADSQAIGGWNGPGPFKISNNYLEAAGENIIFGGADPSGSHMMPQDIEIRNNYLFKPLAWKANNPDWVVKNLFELKLGLRVLVEGNVMENNWTDAQNGFGVLFTVRNQDGTAPYSEVSDVTFRYNRIINSESGINLHASDYNATSQVTRRIDMSNNLFEGITGRVIQTGTSVGAGSDYRFNHNTIVSSGYNNLWSLGDDTSIKYDRFKFNNNIALHGLYGIFGSGTGTGNSALNSYLTNYEVTKNVFVGGGSAGSYPAGNYFVSAYSSVGFVDFNNKNYTLSSSSQYRNSGTDGQDLGFNAPTFYALTNCVVGGTCGGGSGATPAPTSTTVRDGYGDTLSLTKLDGWFYDSSNVDTSAVITYVNVNDSTKTYTQTASRTVTRTDAANWLTQTYGSNLSITQPLGFSVNPSSVVTAPGTYKVQSIKLNSSNTNIALSSSASGTFTVVGNTGLPVVSSFTATPTIITVGQGAVLNWSVSGATSISIDQGVGDVTSRLSPTVTISPTVTTTYTLTASNNSGSTTKQVTVSLTSLEPNPGSGEVVTWTSMKNMTLSNGVISKTSGRNDGVYDASAISTKQCSSGDCYIEFTADQLSDVLWIGFSKDLANSSAQPSSIDFALHYFYYDTGGFFETYAMESAVYKGEEYPTPPGAILRLAIEGGKVRYYHNGQIFYTSSTAPTYPMVIKVLTNKMGTGVGNVVFKAGTGEQTPTPTTVRDGYGDTLSLTKFDGWFYDSTGADTQAVITYVNTSDSTKTYTQTATRTVTRTDAANWLTTTYGSNLVIAQPLGFSVNPSSVVTAPGTYKVQSIKLNSSNANIALSSSASGTFTVATGNTGGAVLSNQVTINTATQNQSITGWEATAQAWQLLEQGTSSQYATNDNPAFAQYRNALFDHMVNVLGITRLRVEMHSGVENPTDYFSQFLSKQISFSQYFSKAYEIINDNTSSSSINSSGFKFASIDHQIDKVLLPVKSRVEARGDKFHFNLCYVDFGTSSFEHYNDPNEYAELMLAFFQHSQSKYGFVPDTIELVLEPDNTPWNGTRLGQAMQATQTKLAAAGFTPKFVLPSVTNIANAVSYFDAARSVVGDSFISSHVKEFSYHRYGGATSSQLSSVASRATQLGVGTSHLEYIGANVDNLFDDLGVGNNSAWSQYTIAWPTSDGSDDGGKYYLIDGSNQVVVGTRTMSLAQVMNYVRPGARRVGATSNQGGLKTLGFTNSNGKEVVVVKNNIGSTSFSVLGLSSGTYGVSYVRDGQTTRTSLADTTITAGQPVNVTMPGGGTATIYKK